MIHRLSIQGLAIIDSLSIEFSPGFNVITGETGAGKSILIKGLNFLMGGKASADAVRKGSSVATVTGEFVVPEGHPALEVMGMLGIPSEETENGVSIILRRQLTDKGRSQSWVNDVVVTSQPLKELGATLVDVFGQHENQRLMDPGQHTRYLDNFLAEKGARFKVEVLNKECQALLGELRGMVTAFHDRYRHQDYLTFRLKELSEFSPAREDYDEVVRFCQQAGQVSNIRDTVGRALAILDGLEGEGSATKAVWEAEKALQAGTEFAEIRARLTSVATELEDVSYELGKRVSSMEFSEEEMEEKQQRLFGYQDLFRKHSVTEIGALVGEAERLKEELSFLESASAKLEENLLALAKKAVDLQKAAKVLTKAREAAAAQTRKRVERELHELAMPGSVFAVEFAPVSRSLGELDLSPFPGPLDSHWKSAKTSLESVGEQGSERCQFLLASNPGEPILPLTRIASGGELSRIMLALKKALMADAETCVLVFDEIDTGISGRVADVVGRKMYELAQEFQVICISHLPQVAVYADSHFLVAKAGKKDRTESSIIRLTKDESAREIARLLSGAEVSAPSLKNAKSLIEKARSGAKRTRPRLSSGN